MAQLEASQTSIVEQEFNLLMNQLELDRDEWRVYKHKLANYAASVSKLCLLYTSPSPRDRG